jgi:serine/threonine-protein kinase
MEIRCPDPACGRVSHLGDDGLGRIFRCPRCRTKLAPAVSPDRAATPVAIRSPRPEEAEIAAAAPPSGGSTAVRLGRFLIRATLGTGTFATTFRAYDPYLDRDVALKVLHAADPPGPGGTDHVLGEAKTLARLQHPRIVPIFEAGRDGSHYYIAMPFIEGRTLSEVVADGPVDPRDAARIIGDVAEALSYAHGLGVVHRDVKPANILLDAGGAAHLMDFGLAHWRDSAADPSRDDAILGTPAYMAPEQARGGGADPLPANDQYSLGVVLYELLCGRPPFSGPPLVVLIAAIHHEPPRPVALDPGLPPALEAICLKALAKRPRDRYASCEDLAGDLRRWLRGEEAAMPPSRPWRTASRWLRPVRDLAATVLG